MNRKQGYALIASYVFTFLLVLGLIVYIKWYVNDNNRKWCEVLAPLDDAYKSAPITSPVGQKVRTAIHNRVVDFEC